MEVDSELRASKGTVRDAWREKRAVETKEKGDILSKEKVSVLLSLAELVEISV